MRNDKENVIVEKSIDFSLAIIKYCEVLEQDRKYMISKQFFEAQNAESKADFIHKMKIASKEASETLYWLTLCDRTESYMFDKRLKEQLEEMGRILSKIISSSKGGLRSFIWFALVSFSNFQIFKLTH